MKRLFSVVLCLVLLLSFTGCGGSYGQVNLQEPVAIPEDGIISENIVRQLKAETAIGNFQGQSNGFAYEWTIFGSDITDASEINLNVDIVSVEDGIQLQFSQEQPFGFPALLSVQLKDTWDAQSATAYRNDTAVYSVSLTGSKETIVNLSVRDVLGTCIIRPDALPEETVLEETIQLQVPETEPAETQQSGGSYLSAVTEGDNQVYTDGKDKYLTDPIPEGKPKPVEPENQEVNTATTYTCTFSIECSTLLTPLSPLSPSSLPFSERAAPPPYSRRRRRDTCPPISASRCHIPYRKKRFFPSFGNFLR